MPNPQTLAEKVWERHVVHRADGEPDLLYVDLHLVHEVTSPQAFDGLRMHGRPVRRPDLTVATMDHNVPTTIGPGDRPDLEAADGRAVRERRGVRDHALPDGLAGSGHRARDRSGAGLHATGPRDRVRRLAHVHARRVRRARDRHRDVGGRARPRDADAAADQAGHDGGDGRGRTAGRRRGEGRDPGDHRPDRDGRRRRSRRGVPRLGDPRALDGGPHDDLQHVDRGRRSRGHDRARRHDVRLRRGSPARAARARTGSARSKTGARCRPTTAPRSTRRWRIDAAELRPYVSWGTNPSQSVTIDGAVPDPEAMDDAGKREAAIRALAYMALAPGTPIREIRPDTIFIGSCTNSRIEDLRVAAGVVGGRKVAGGLRALVVPGSFAVKEQAEREGLDRVFADAGFEWRGAGCSMCLGMNPDILGPGDRSASTSNRNFEGRQGKGGRTHLVSPAVAAATAIAGHFSHPGGSLDGTDPRHRGHRAPGRPLRRRHRPDHPRRVPQAHRAHGVRAVPVRGVAQGSRLRDQRPALRGRVDPARRRELRMRLQPGARAVGDRGRRLPRDDRAELRATSSGTTARRSACCPVELRAWSRCAR